ncbi:MULTISPECIES: hypothetical protein [Thioalkalivibrio]|uniref:hypothetical protein n=1 Tax=unclassified Thioalkalivibrio TaxID=2621013 RepID=UPI000365E244
MPPDDGAVIVLFCTRAHDRTHRVLERSRRMRFRVIPYERLFRMRRLPRATFIFTDFDRLDFWDLEMAARVYRRVREAGARALNDPARVSSRFRLLRDLAHDGWNDFGVWRVHERPPAEAFPVFLRTDSAHRGVLTDLLVDEQALERAIARALDDGIPLRELMVVQYCATPLAEGLYRKLAAYRVGERTVPALSVHQSCWHAKSGELGIAGQAHYEEEYAQVERNPYGDALLPAFERGYVEYGRADFSLVGGRPQVYEINTNPTVSRVRTHPYAIRLEACRLARERLQDAMAEIDGPPSGPAIPLPDDRSLARRLVHLWRTGQWRRTPPMR